MRDSDNEHGKTEVINSLKNHFLIAMPTLTDPYFKKSVVYLCEHDAEGAMGFIINFPVKLTVQELLNNSRKHAQPTQTQVQLDMGYDRVLAAVEDNGSGFIVDDALASSARDTIGLPSIRERITMLGGDFDIQSSLGQGTRAEFTIPVSSGSEIVS